MRLRRYGAGHSSVSTGIVSGDVVIRILWESSLPGRRAVRPNSGVQRSSTRGRVYGHADEHIRSRDDMETLGDHDYDAKRHCGRGYFSVGEDVGFESSVFKNANSGPASLEA